MSPGDRAESPPRLLIRVDEFPHGDVDDMLSAFDVSVFCPSPTARPPRQRRDVTDLTRVSPRASHTASPMRVSVVLAQPPLPEEALATAAGRLLANPAA